MFRSLLLTALVIGSPLGAEDASGAFAIKGAGLQTCQALDAAWAAGSSDLPLYVGWIDGYLTGMNQHLPDTFDAAPWQTSTTLLGLTRQLCRNRADDARIIDVFNDLMRDFRPARLTESSPASAIQRGESALALYTRTVEALQQRLIDQGYLDGTADGVFDDATAAALETFQADRGLAASGLPDQATLFALFVTLPE